MKLNCTQYLDMCSKCKVAVDDVTLTIPLDVNFPSFFVNVSFMSIFYFEFKLARMTLHSVEKTKGERPEVR